MKQNLKSIAGNFRYLFRELYLFRRGSVFLPVLGSVSQIFLSLTAVWLPKLVLDLVESRAEPGVLLLRVTSGSAVLFAVSAVNAVVHNRIDSCAQVFLFTRLKPMWEEKMMVLDYEAFSSPEGKIRAERARNAIDSPNFGAVTYLRSVTELMEGLGGLFALGALVCMLHPLVLAALFVLFSVELFYGVRSERRKHFLQEERARANRKLNYMAYHTRGFREGKDIRVYSMTGWLRKAAGEAVADKDKVEKKAARQNYGKMVLNGLLLFLRNGCAYIYLLWRFFQGHMTIGDFSLAFSAVNGVGGFLARVVQGYSGFMESDNYVTDFRLFMGWNMREGKKNPVRKAQAIKIAEKPVSFTWENVSFSYGGSDHYVLKNVNLTIKAGEKLAIVGANGAGKTTFVKLLCGMIRPKEGRILAAGVDAADFDEEEYRNLFSAVFQKSGVLPVSIRDNIVSEVRQCEVRLGGGTVSDKREAEAQRLGGKDRKSGQLSGSRPENIAREKRLDGAETMPGDEAVWRCLRLANLEEKVRSLPEGLDTCLGKGIAEHGTELSGGQLQRLLLARALYRDASVLVLDEPTAALDPIAESEIYESYNRLTEGKTSVFISHRLASTRFCDRILVMENGEIVESGTHDELMMRGGRYAEMYHVQSRYYTEETL